MARLVFPLSKGFSEMKTWQAPPLYKKRPNSTTGSVCPLAQYAKYQKISNFSKKFWKIFLRFILRRNSEHYVENFPSVKAKWSTVACYVFVSRFSYGMKNLVRFPFGGGRFSETANSGGATLRTGCGEWRSWSEHIFLGQARRQDFIFFLLPPGCLTSKR